MHGGKVLNYFFSKLEQINSVNSYQEDTIEDLINVRILNVREELSLLLHGDQKAGISHRYIQNP